MLNETTSERVEQLRGAHEMSFSNGNRELLFGKVDGKPLAAVVHSTGSEVHIGEVLQFHGSPSQIDREVERYARLGGFRRSPITDEQIAEIHGHIQEEAHSTSRHMRNAAALNSGPMRDLFVARVVDESFSRRGKLLGRGIGLSRYESGIFGIYFGRRVSLSIYAETGERIRRGVSAVGLDVDYSNYLTHLEESLRNESDQENRHSAEVVAQKFGVPVDRHINWLASIKSAGARIGTAFFQPDLDPAAIRGVLVNIAGQVREARPPQVYFDKIEKFFVS